MNALLVAGAALLVFGALAWTLAGPLLHLQGARFWLLFGGLTAIAAAVAAVILLFRRQQEQAKSSQQAPSDASSGEELDLLVREAQAKLARSPKAPGARLADLPVVLLLGTPGSSKTTLMMHSELEPELLSGQAEQESGIVPTRSINVWFARKFIFLETAANVLNDDALWRKLIRALRPAGLAAIAGREPHAGRAAVVCVDSERIANASGNALETLARDLRASLEAMSETLGIHVPVYVLFTKMDLFPWFPDYARNLTPEEARQIAGVTLPLAGRDGAGSYAEEQTRLIGGAFDKLFYSLAERRCDLLFLEQNAPELSGIYEFPRELRKFRDPLVRFLVDLCRPKQLTVSPFLRGFYFCGIRPVVRSDVVAEQWAPEPALEEAPEVGATNIFRRPQADARRVRAIPKAAPGSRRVPEWVFLAPFFRQVLLQDGAGLRTSQTSTRTAFLRRVALLAVASLALILCGCFWYAYVQNRDLERPVLAAARHTPTIEALKQMDDLRKVTETLAGYEDQGNSTGLGLHWGMYHGKDLYPEARRIYFHRWFRPLFLRPVQERLLDTLQKAPSNPPPPGTAFPRELYDAVRAYLITAAYHQYSTKAWLSPILMEYWSQGKTLPQDQRELVPYQLDYYSQQLALKNPFTDIDIKDDEAVKHARQYLWGFGDAEFRYRGIIEAANAVANRVVFNESSVVGRAMVEGAYTKSGWAIVEKTIRKGGADVDAWVLDKPSGGPSAGGGAGDLLARYKNDYIERWRTFVRKSEVVPYNGLKDAATKLHRTADGNQSALLKLFAVVSENTSVDPEIAAKFQPVVAVVPAGSMLTPQNPVNTGYIQSLTGLALTLDQAADSDADPNSPAIAQSRDKAQFAHQAAASISVPNDPDGKLDENVKKLLSDPIALAEQALKGAGSGDLNAKGKGFCEAFHVLVSKYPFSPKGNPAQPAKLEDLNDIFRPATGKVSVLKNAITQSKAQPTPEFKRFFDLLETFQQAAYPNNAQQPQLPFTLTSRNVEGLLNLDLAMDDKELANSGGNATPVSKQFTWPVRTVKFSFNGQKADFSGDWAVFDFFGSAEPEWQLVGSSYRLTWKEHLGRIRQEGVPLVLDLDGHNGKFFQPGYFQALHCPSKVAQ
ncbi:MAG TPA: type VI secretion protein IcmF/TssM N-terminal domain-containing protein [Bryobacteraceae bacterium]|nr:type VI secretion protein IcmF/TssM N-terminal domain-containing protein [Bryobacteraceae bacterium]